MSELLGTYQLILISWLLIVAFNVNNRWNVVFKPVYIEKSQGGGLTSQVLPDQTIDSRNFCQYKLQILNLKTEEKAGGFAKDFFQMVVFRWVFACANNCLNPLFYGIVGKRWPLLSLTPTKKQMKITFSHFHHRTLLFTREIPSPLSLTKFTSNRTQTSSKKV